MNGKQQLDIILEVARVKIPELAQKTGLNRSTFYSIDKGLSKSISSKTAKAICTVFTQFDYGNIINGRNPVKENHTKPNNLNIKTTSNKIKVGQYEVSVDDYLIALKDENNLRVLQKHPLYIAIVENFKKDGMIELLTDDTAFMNAMKAKFEK